MDKKIKINQLPGAIKAELLIPLIALTAFINPAVRNDSWFILNCGRYIENHGLPVTEVFTMHSGLNAIFQQWLSDLLIWKVYDSLGGIGIMLLLVIVYFISAFILYRLCMLVSDKNHFVSSIVTLIVMSLTVAFYLIVRPQSFTIVILLASLYCLETYAKTNTPKSLIPLPFLSVALINFHASMWPVLFVLSLPYIADSFKFNFKIVKCAGVKKLPLFITLFVSLLCGFINPYGLKAMTYLFRSYNLDYVARVIDEMQAITVSEAMGAGLMLCFIITLLSIVVRLARGKCSVPLRYCLLVCGFGVMMFTSYRNGMFFVTLSMFTLAFCFKDCNPSITLRSKKSADGKLQKKVLNILICILVIACTAAGALGLSLKIDDANGVSDARGAVEYLTDNYNTKGKKVFTGYNDGAYCEYMGLRVYMDSRAELFFKSNNGREDIFTEYIETMVGVNDFYEFMDKYDFDYLIVSRDELSNTYIKTLNTYELAYEDENRLLYVKK